MNLGTDGPLLSTCQGPCFYASAIAIVIALVFSGVCLAAAPSIPDESGTVTSLSSYGDLDAGSDSGQSVHAELAASDRIKPALVPFNATGEGLSRYYQFRQEVKRALKLEFSADYTTLFQHASATLSGDNDAASQAFRVLGTWLQLGDSDATHGHLVWKLEYRGAIGGKPAPRDMGFDTGSTVSTANYSELGWDVTNLYWRQYFQGDRFVFNIGHMDPHDWVDQYPLLNAWTNYLNDAFFTNPTEALPKRGFGILGQAYLSETLYLMGGVNSANSEDGKLDFSGLGDPLETLTWAEFGYRGDRSIHSGHNLHLHVWEKDGSDIERSRGVTVTYSNVTDSGLTSFVRAGYSEGEEPQLRRFIGLGVSGKMFDRDTIGVATSWGSPPDRSLRDQVTSEAFYRLQISQNVSMTPNLQLFYQPSYNPAKDWISVVGLRFRVVF